MNKFNKMINSNTKYHDFNYHILSKEEIISSQILPSNIIKSNSRYLNWLSNEGQLYYFKHFNLNDFIGEQLCKILNLECAEYDLAMVKGGIQTISKNFIDNDFEYYNIKNIHMYFNKISSKEKHVYTLEMFLKTLIDLGFKKDIIDKLIDNLLKMSAIDYFSRQTDRYFNNYMFKIRDFDISLAPVYDFGESFSFNGGSYMEYGFNYGYNNELLNISWSNFFYNELIKKYPNLRLYLEKMYYINLKEIILNICRKYNLDIDDDLMDIYAHEENISKMRIKELI